MKKVLFLGGLRPGGAEHQMVILARLLKKEGYDVTYLSTDTSNFFLNDLESAGIRLIRLKENRFISILKLSIPCTILKLYKLLKEARYDTVISFLGEWNFYNCLLANCNATRHRAITGIRNNRDEVFLRPRERFYTKFERNSYCKVSNSYSAKHKFAQYFPFVKSKLTVIYNVVELPLITSQYECKAGSKVNIIVPASYREVKNPIRMLEAVALLSYEERTRLRIDWYGNIKASEGTYQLMNELIQKYNLSETVFLHDATNDIANRMNQADFVALFSTSEGLPNAICEGMMLYKPIIMSTVSDYEVLVDESNGYLCDPMDVLSIKDALSSASSLSAMDIQKMGQNSKRKAELLFSEINILQQWMKII